MRVVLEYDYPSGTWSSWLENSDHLQLMARLGPFPDAMTAAKSLFANIGGEPCTIPAWALDEYVGG